MSLWIKNSLGLERKRESLFELIFLGTSASAPSARRGLPAQVVKHDEYRFLIDCGEGTQRQILKSGIGFKRLNRILLTHGHLDHILGLAGLISTLMRWEAMEELEIMGGKYTMERVSDLINGVVLRGTEPPVPIHLTELQAGTFLEAEDFNVTAFPVFHRGTDSFGYIFEEKGRRPFLPEKAEALNIPQGPWRRDLVDGKAITLPDGRIIDPQSVLGDFKPGTRLVHIGDVGDLRGLEEYCRDADALVIESTYLQEDRDMARKFSHSTAHDAAELAVRAGVKQLFLTHISRRYRTKDVLKEAQEVFPNAVVAQDLDAHIIKHAE